ncbi:hypothetical protein ACFWD7_13370 [Streptomyces mirabilis]
MTEVLREAIGGPPDPSTPLPLDVVSAVAASRGRQLYLTHGGSGG